MRKIDEMVVGTSLQRCLRALVICSACLLATSFATTPMARTQDAGAVQEPAGGDDYFVARLAVYGNERVSDEQEMVEVLSS